MDFVAAVFVTNSWFLVLIAEMLLLMIIKSPSSLNYSAGNPFPAAAGQAGAFRGFPPVHRRAFTISEKKILHILFRQYWRISLAFFHFSINNKMQASYMPAPYCR
jgi:hypothetical protein